MKRMRLAGLGLLAALALSATAAGTALAAHNGEFGECIKVAAGTGVYGNSGCTVAGGEKKFVWHPLASPDKFTSSIKPETIATLETVGKTKVTCKHETGTGEIANTKEFRNVVSDFTECSSSGFACISAGAKEGEIVTKALSGETGLEKLGETEAKNKLAAEFHPQEGTRLVEFSCAGIPIEVIGSVLHPFKAGSMLAKATEKFSAKAGEQKPSCYLGSVDKEDKGLPDRDNEIPGCHSLESNSAGGEFEETGQTLTAIAVFSRKVELNPTKG
jgi:hypothetical protein